MRIEVRYNEGMKVTTLIRVEPEDSQTLLYMIRNFNDCCNWLSVIAFQEKLFHWLPLQRRAYYEAREKFGLSAAATVVAIRKVAYAYKDKRRRHALATFHPLGSIPLFKHVYYGDKTVGFYGLRMPFQIREGVTLPKHPKEGNLSFREDRFFIQQSLDVNIPETYYPQDFLGCDMGIVNILVDSEGQVYSSKHLNGIRKRHAKLRSRLQSKGTASAKRLLRKRHRKESLFASDINHCISKQVVAKAKTVTWGIALEDLKGIRDHIQVRKAQRRQHHAWSFDQLRRFITYKAALSGVPVVLVDPYNTSRTCPECNHVDKANRVNQAEFYCVSCGYSGLADAVAARNISRRGAGDYPYAFPPGKKRVLVIKGQLPKEIS